MSREVQVRFCESRAVRSRPATHLVVLVNGTRADVEALHDDVATVLAPLGLRLSPAKTQIRHMSDGFDFLGFHIQWRRKRGTNKRYVYTFIADRPVRSLKAKIRALTRRTSQVNPRDVPGLRQSRGER
jgi:RNA-directed DNA polymerase